MCERRRHSQNVLNLFVANYLTYLNFSHFYFILKTIYILFHCSTPLHFTSASSQTDLATKFRLHTHSMYLWWSAAFHAHGVPFIDGVIESLWYIRIVFEVKWVVWPATARETIYFTMNFIRYRSITMCVPIYRSLARSRVPFKNHDTYRRWQRIHLSCDPFECPYVA